MHIYKTTIEIKKQETFKHSTFPKKLNIKTELRQFLEEFKLGFKI